MKLRDDNPSILSDLLEKGVVIAEIGCGSGRYCKYLANYSSMLYCIDIDTNALGRTNELLSNIGNIKFKTATSVSEISDGTVDIVLFANSFHDISGKAEMEEEAARILKESGKVVIIDWKKGMPTPFGPPQGIRMSEGDYMEYFHDFIIEKKFSTGNYHFGMVLSRRS